MKRHLAYIILLCTAGLFISPAKAQQKIAITEVKKFILDSGDGFTRGGDNFEFEVLNEQGKWNTYQTKKDVTDSYQPASNIHSIERIQINTVKGEQIAEFLNHLAVIKPHFDAKGLNITADALIGEIKNNARDTAGNTINLNNYITEANLQRAIADIMVDVSVDTYNYLRIRIVKNNNDTLKIETHNSYATMLPWAINDKINTYDMGISDFFIAAMADRYFINKTMLNLYDLKEDIYLMIDAYYYPEHPISTYRLKYCHTDKVK